MKATLNALERLDKVKLLETIFLCQIMFWQDQL